MDNITKNYDPTVPPFTPYNNTNRSRTTVTVQVVVYGIKKVDLMDSTITFKAAIRHWWNDSRTSWDPDMYEGINTIWLKTDTQVSPRGWTPDFIIRQDAGESYLSNMKMTDIKITSDGVNYWSTIGDIKVLASFDVQRYPYDLQNITITYGSWIYSEPRISLAIQSEPLIVYDPIGQWVIDNIEWEFKNHSTTLIR